MVKKRGEAAVTKTELVEIIHGLETRFVASLDRKLGGFDQKFDGLDQKVDGIDQKFDGLDQKVDGLDQKFDGLDQKFDGLDQKVDGLDQKVDGLDQKVDGLDQKVDGVDQKVDGLDQKVDSLDHRVGNMELDIRRLMVESVDTNARMRGMEERLTARLDAGRAEDVSLREAFASRMETIWRETNSFPRILDEHGAALQNHGQRIAALEARQTP